jgi:FSR family fosmidomycin resistance protein-like MFS transporter
LPRAPARAKMRAMSSLSARLSLIFSSLGHSLTHLLMLLYPTVVLVLEREWHLPYGQLLTLAVVSQLLYGFGALPAGWLGDRWSATGMMVVFFLGSGIAAILTGFADGPLGLALGLGLIGLFASIYHPVGTAWMVRNAANRGKALGINGLFGSVGVGLAAIVAGALSDLFSWRAAFFVPGGLSLLIGAAMLVAILSGALTETKTDRAPQPEAGRADIMRVFWVLSFTMFATGLIYQTAVVALPKLFAERLGQDLSTTSIGALVSVVFGITALAQVAGGHLADRWPMRSLYAGGYLLLVPLTMLVMWTTGLPMLVIVTLALVVQVGSVPTENALLAHYTPPRWRATAYGAKFVLALGLSALALPLVGSVEDQSGNVALVFGVIAVLSALVGLAGLLLPAARAGLSPAPQPSGAD